MIEAENGRTGQPVTVSVARRAKPGREAEFEGFISGITSSAARFPGHLGAEVFRPASGDDEWRVVFRFDGEGSLRSWEESEERRAWYARAEELAIDEPRIQKTRGTRAWFELPPRQGAPAPPVHKTNLLSALGVWPLITALLVVLDPVLAPLPLAADTLLLTAILTPVMGYVVMPFLSRLFSGWLYPSGGDGR